MGIRVTFQDLEDGVEIRRKCELCGHHDQAMGWIRVEYEDGRPNKQLRLCGSCHWKLDLLFRDWIMDALHARRPLHMEADVRLVLDLL